MPTADTTPAARRVPGWQRVLDAFMAAPERTLTNVELGDVPGVQAFHQRISDLGRYGYVVTPAIQLEPGYYAYKLVGVKFVDSPVDRPHVANLPQLKPEQIAVEIAAATALVKNTTPLRRRATAPSSAQTAERDSRASRDAAATLAVALGDEVVGDWPAADRSDVLALARAARDEIGRARSLRSLERVNAEQSATIADSVAALQELLGSHIADWPVADRSELRALVRKTVAVHEDAREALAELDRQVQAARRPRAPRQPRADRGPTGPDLMRRALEHHEQPMHAAKIAAWVMDNGGADIYKGATPAATMGAQLATSNVKGGEFVKVAPGCYGLRAWEGKYDGFGNPLLELDPIR